MFKSIQTIIFVILWVFPLFSIGEGYNLSEESNLYEQIANVRLNTTQGDFKLSEIYEKSPLILTLIFTRCTGICSPFLTNLSENIDKLNAKENFRIVVVSFDPEDDVADMERMARRYSLEEDKQWIFAVTDSIDELNNSIGFYPVWDSVRNQFDHDAILVGINENGYIVRKQIGIRGPDALSSVIKEINNSFIISYPLPGENMSFSCFTYDPSTGKKKPSTGLLVLMLPAILTSLLLVWFSLKKPKMNLTNNL